MRKLCVLLIVLILLPADRASAWSDAGHRVVARIAWKLLSPAERSTIAEMIRSNPRFDEDFRLPSDIRPQNDEAEIEWLFTQAAVWPDLVRSRGTEFHRSTWHYINKPLFLTPQDEAAMANQLNVNLRTIIPPDAENSRLNAVQSLKHSLQVLHAASAEKEQKGIHVCWLLHVGGDLHQPLHTTALFSRVAFQRGDRGGNLIPTKRSNNLHSHWDGLLGRRVRLSTIRRLSDDVLANADNIAAAEDALDDLNPEVWVDEGHELCESFVYSSEIRTAVARREARTTSEVEKVTLSDDYRSKAGEIARTRVCVAGHRLAELLKRVAKAQQDVDVVAAEISISGLLPNPRGTDRKQEAVRLKNATADPFPLAGWSVRDDDGDVLRLSGSVDGDTEKDIVDTAGTLRLSNRGETVELVSPSGQVVHRVRYTKSQVREGEFVEF